MDFKIYRNQLKVSCPNEDNPCELLINVNLNIVDKSLTNANLSLNRNMHCWALSIYWTPIGGNKSFLVSLRNTSSIFRDAKIEFRKPPAFL